MRRRPLVATIAGAGAGIAGCLGDGSDDPEPTIDGENVSVAPGEERTVTVAVEEAGSVLVSALPEAEGVTLPLEEASFSVAPDGRDDSYPPYWHWSPTEEAIEIELPVRVADDAEPGEYRYEISAWSVEVEGGEGVDRIDAEAVREEFTIEVAPEEPAV